MPLQWNVTEVEEKGIGLLRIRGDLDFNERSRFNAALWELEQSICPKLVVDLTQVQRINSAYVGTIADFGKRMKDEKKTVVLLVQERMAEVCRKTAIGQVVQIIAPASRQGVR